MTDYFAFLHEPRRPWLDPELLKARFLALSAEVHPDRVHGASAAEKDSANQRFVDLNTAYHCLREPRDRLVHLLELESGEKPKKVQPIAADTTELAMEVGQLCRAVDSLIAERAKVSSPLLKVQFFERSLEWTERLKALHRKVEARREQSLDELKRMNVAWEAAPAIGTASRLNYLPLEKLDQAYRSFSYISRWTEQMQERIVQLSF
jgi:DnaJ-domain-containing protein 1